MCKKCAHIYPCRETVSRVLACLESEKACSIHVLDRVFFEYKFANLSIRYHSCIYMGPERLESSCERDLCRVRAVAIAEEHSVSLNATSHVLLHPFINNLKDHVTTGLRQNSE